MGANTFGTNFCLTTFGESHGEAIGGVIDGCPAGMQIDFNMIEEELRRRKTASTTTSSQRKESDKIIFLSGVFEGKTLGTPVAFMPISHIIRNTASAITEAADAARQEHCCHAWWQVASPNRFSHLKI